MSNQVLTGFDGKTRTVKEWMKAHEITEVHSRHGDWGVSDYGLECLTTYYPIEASRLWEREEVYGWARHMSEKRWVNLPDFLEALEAAREHHMVPSK